MTARTEDMVSIPRAELDALRAENRRLRREAGDVEALRRIRSDSGEGRTFTRGVHAVSLCPRWPYVKAPMPVMARPTMRVCMVSVPSKVWIASRSTMWRMTW